MAQVYIRCRWIQPQLNAQWLAGGLATCQLSGEFGLDDKLVAATLGNIECSLNFWSGRGLGVDMIGLKNYFSKMLDKSR